MEMEFEWVDGALVGDKLLLRDKRIVGQLIHTVFHGMECVAVRSFLNDSGLIFFSKGSPDAAMKFLEEMLGKGKDI